MGEYKYALKRLKELEVEIIGLAETNIPWMPNEISIARKKLKEECNGRRNIDSSWGETFREAYRVQQESSGGTSTAYTQQKKLLRKKEIDNLKPKQQWIKDMIRQINKWKEDDKILLMTDINDTIGLDE
eukprot:12537709-Ditylum_brightwellii.AAC.1